MRLLQYSCLLALCVNGSPLPPSTPRSLHLPKWLITLEEHAVSPSLEAEIIASGFVQKNGQAALDKLKDVGAGRIAAMDAGKVSRQVLAQQSASGSEDLDGCQKANNAIRSAIDANPTRFAAFAVIPMAFPTEAAAELERSVTKLGFKGAMIWNHLKNGTYYDAPQFYPVFAMAEKLDVPLYLHPAAPATEIFQKLFVGNYNTTIASKLSTNSFGWHVDVGTHVLRLYGAGLFDRFPKLKIIIGHNGEDLPMFIDRIDSTGLRSDTTFERVWTTNIWATTSAFFTLRQFQQLKLMMPIERIMYSVDYPFSSMTDGWAFVEQLAQSNILTAAEMDAFAYKNAEKLLKL